MRRNNPALLRDLAQEFDLVPPQPLQQRCIQTSDRDVAGDEHQIDEDER